MRTATSGFEALLRDRGAVIVARDGGFSVAHYGSAASELAVCVSAVGLAWRTDLALLRLTAPAERLESLVSHVNGVQLASGGATLAERVWWCRARAGELTLICPASALPRVRSTSLACCPYLGISIEDHSAATALIALAGRRTWELLARLGVCDASGDVRGVPPFSCGEIDGQPVRWLVESAYAALALFEADVACELWRAIETAGRPLGVSCVGEDALVRFSLHVARDC